MTLLDEAPVVESRCESCGAVMAFGAALRSERCPFCDTPSVVSRPATAGRPQPAFALGFIVERADAERAVMDWIRRQRMAPRGLKADVAERIIGIYLPAYLYSATAQTQYRASIGETYTTLGLEGNDEGRTSIRRQEKTEYRDLAGRHVTHLADILVTASRTLANQEVEAIEPFDFSRLRRFSPALVTGWTAEEPTLSPQESLSLAQAEARERIGHALHRFMPGDAVRSLQCQTELVNESLELVLVPVWVCAVRYRAGKPPIRLLVSGQTGRVGGARLFSWSKLAVLAAVVLALVAILLITLGALVGGS
jgi:hypothetical protein